MLRWWTCTFFGLIGAVPAQGNGADAQQEQDRARVAAARLELLHRFTFAELGLVTGSPGWPEQLCFDGSGRHVCVSAGARVATVTIADGSHVATDLPGSTLLGPAPAGICVSDDRNVYAVDPVHPRRGAPFTSCYAKAVCTVAPDGTRLLTHGTFHFQDEREWRTVRLAFPTFSAAAFDEALGRTAIAFALTSCIGGGRSGCGIEVLAKDGQRVAAFEPPPFSATTALAFSLDGQRLYCCDEGTRLLDVATRKVLAQDPRRQWSLFLVDPVLAIGHDARELTFWDAAHLVPVKNEPIDDPPVFEEIGRKRTELVAQLRFCREAELLALANGTGLRVYRVHRGGAGDAPVMR
jgi:hypothetical protein